MSYDNALTITYKFPAAAVDTAAVMGRLRGPDGLKGRIRSMDYVMVAATTVAVSNLIVGIAADTDKFASSVVPITAINGGASDVTLAADAATGEKAIIDADADVIITSDGGATAGDCDIYITIDWFK